LRPLSPHLSHPLPRGKPICTHSFPSFCLFFRTWCAHHSQLRSGRGQAGTAMRPKLLPWSSKFHCVTIIFCLPLFAKFSQIRAANSSHMQPTWPLPERRQPAAPSAGNTGGQPAKRSRGCMPTFWCLGSGVEGPLLF
jgi:hypothetical protein